MSSATREQSSTVYTAALRTGLFKGDFTAEFSEERGAFGGRWTTRCRADSFIRDAEVLESRRREPGCAGAAERSRINADGDGEGGGRTSTFGGLL